MRIQTLKYAIKTNKQTNKQTNKTTTTTTTNRFSLSLPRTKKTGTQTIIRNKIIEKKKRRKKSLKYLCVYWPGQSR